MEYDNVYSYAACWRASETSETEFGVDNWKLGICLIHISEWACPIRCIKLQYCYNMMHLHEEATISVIHDNDSRFYILYYRSWPLIIANKCNRIYFLPQFPEYW